MGSMAAGAFTGLLYKSTGAYASTSVFRHLIYFVYVSWGQTCRRRGGLHGRYGGDLESCQKERVIARVLVIYNCILSLLTRSRL